MGAPEIEAFLTWLANGRGASVSTHKQALAALVFLYKQVLGVDLPWLQEIGRPRSPQRLPVVLSRAEVQLLLAATAGEHQLVFRLLYGTGMRKMECLRLRVKDLDFDRRLIVIREGKGHKDRITMLPDALEPDLRRQLAYANALWAGDRGAGCGMDLLVTAAARALKAGDPLGALKQLTRSWAGRESPMDSRIARSRRPWCVSEGEAPIRTISAWPRCCTRRQRNQLPLGRVKRVLASISSRPVCHRFELQAVSGHALDRSGYCGPGPGRAHFPRLGKRE
jgi:integrase